MLTPSPTWPFQARLYWVAEQGERKIAVSQAVLEELLQDPALQQEQDSQSLTAEAHRLLAWLAFWRGDSSLANTHLLRAWNDNSPLSTHINLKTLHALIADRSGNTEESTVELSQLIEQCRTHNLDKELALTGNYLGFIVGRSGQLEQGMVLHFEALRAARRIKAYREEAASLMHIGTIHHRKGQLAEARSFWTQALERAQSADYPKLQAICHNNLAILLEFTGDYPAALEHHHQSLALKHQLEDRVGVANSLNNIGFICFRQNRLEEATNYLNQAGHAADTLQVPWLQAYVAYGLSRVFRLQGNFQASLSHALRSLEIRRSLKTIELVIASLTACCDAVLATKDPEHPHFSHIALWFHEANDLIRSSPARDIQLELLRVGMEYARLRGKESEAMAYEKRYQELQQQLQTVVTNP